MNKIDEQSKKFNDLLVGKKVAEARYLTKDEADEWGLKKIPLVLFFSDNSLILFLSDNEGNNGGAAHYQKGDEQFTIPTL